MTVLAVIGGVAVVVGVGYGVRYVWRWTKGATDLP